jgi:tetratricopeptide (TPR) repeat protein
MSRARWMVVTVALFCLAPAAWAEYGSTVVAVIGVGEERQSPELKSLQEGLVHLVQSELAARSAARLVSRRRTALFLEELGMGTAQLTEPGTGQRFGSALSADYLALVQISGDGVLRASVTVTQVSSGKQVWGCSFSGRAEALGSLATSIAGALVEALHLPPAQAAAAEAGPAPTVAVLDFRSGGPAGPLDRHLADLADLLSADLSALEVPLVERQKLGAVLDELGLSASGLVRNADMAKVGRLLGAQRMVDTAVIASGQTDSQVIEPETGLVVGSCRVSSDEQHLPSAVQGLAMELAEVLRVPITAAGRSALLQQATSSLEAALHAAVGWRLGGAGRAEEAVKEYQQAVYLDPSVAWWWLDLGQQYQAMDDNGHYAEVMRRFLALSEGRADPGQLSQIACALADAEIWLGHAAESEAAARLALHYKENQHGYYRLIHALAEQNNIREARQFCDSLVTRENVPHYQLVRAWDFLLGWFAWPASEQRSEETVMWELDNVARALDVFDEGDWDADTYLGTQLTNALLACSLGVTQDTFDLDPPASHLQECLALAHRMVSEFADGISIPGRGWFLIGILEYKRGHGERAVAALHRCLDRYPEANYDSGNMRTRVGSSHGRVYYALGRVEQDLLSDPTAAIDAYQRALLLLDSDRSEAQEAAERLHMLGGAELPPRPWLTRVGGAGRPLEFQHRRRLSYWLRAEGYDLRLRRDDTIPQQLASQGIQVLVWERQPYDCASAEQLRSYVASGGNLLVCLTWQPYIDVIGPTAATSSESMATRLDWLLPAFGMDMSGRARVRWQESTLPLGRLPAFSAALPSDHREAGAFHVAGPIVPVGIALDESASYDDAWFPLLVPPDMAVLTIGGDSDEVTADVVVAARKLGLGKMAVVSLQGWFPGTDTNEERDPWQYALLADLLDWYGNDELFQQHPGAAEHWAAARKLVALEEYGAAVQELDEVGMDVPSGSDARYWAGCLLADKLGDIDGAAQRWREVIAAEAADAWLVRMAHLRLGTAAVRAGDERTCAQELALAAGDTPDGIWGQAWVAGGDLKLAQGDYLGAAQAFRKVADELGHCEERFRALFGLAYSLARQGKPEAAGRVYDAIVVEFGKAPLPSDMDVRWPDPWEIYYPPDKRSDEPTVADAVAAARLL